MDTDRPDMQMFFPPNIFSTGDEHHAFIADWYGNHLAAMEEPSLLELAHNPEAHVYRFLWLRTFHQPIAVRLMVEAGEKGMLVSKRLDGAGGYEPGNLVVNETRPISAKQVENWLSRLDDMRYWTMPTVEEGSVGVDGAQWIIEGVRNGKYHLVDRWNPDTGAFRDACLWLLSLADVPIDEIY